MSERLSINSNVEDQSNFAPDGVTPRVNDVDKAQLMAKEADPNMSYAAEQRKAAVVLIGRLGMLPSEEEKKDMDYHIKRADEEGTFSTPSYNELRLSNAERHMSNADWGEGSANNAATHIGSEYDRGQEILNRDRSEH